MYFFVLFEENIICRNFVFFYDIDEEVVIGILNGVLVCYLYYY